VGKAKGYGKKRGVCAGACAKVGDICEWGFLCGARIMAGFFVGACVPSVYLRWAFSGAPSNLSSCKI